MGEIRGGEPTRVSDLGRGGTVMVRVREMIRKGELPGPYDGQPYGDVCPVCGAVAHVRPRDPEKQPRFVASDQPGENERAWTEVWSAYRIEPIEHDASQHVGEAAQVDLELEAPKRTSDEDEDYG